MRSLLPGAFGIKLPAADAVKVALVDNERYISLAVLSYDKFNALYIGVLGRGCDKGVRAIRRPIDIRAMNGYPVASAEEFAAT